MTATLQNARLLLIDDEPFMRRLVQRLLSDLGVRSVAEAGDGMTALRLLKAGETKVDCILLDLEMPQMSGLEFLGALRDARDTPFATLPVIVLTGHANRANILDAARLGIHGFLVKPVSKALLDRELHKALTAEKITPEALPPA